MKEHEFFAMNVIAALDAAYAALQRTPPPADDEVCVHGVSLDDPCEECYEMSQGVEEEG